MRLVERHFDSLVAAGAADMVDALLFRAAERPDAPALVLLERGEAAAPAVTYAALLDRAQRIAGGLRRRLPRGARAILSYPAGPDFVAALFGCFLAGVIAVPAPPHSRRSAARIAAMAADCGASLILSPDADVSDEPLHRPLPRSAREIALLQYTSGSTAAPKGVAVTHGAIWHNQAVIRTCFDHADGVTLVGWLPNFHDLGLIGNLLQPIYAGGVSVMMPPAAFTQKPMRWLWAVSDWKAHTSGAPNFAYDLCVRAATMEACAGLDLSHWRVAFNGAEPVRAETLDAFAERFAACGFRASAFMACYGLAESTLMVTGSRIGQGPKVMRASRSGLAAGVLRAAQTEPEVRLVGCGDAVTGTDVRIDADTPDGVGEILVRSPSVCAGYWRDAPAAPDRWLRTGDLGVVQDGELFVVGRAKDLIILNGRNIHPADVEAAVTERFAGLGVQRAVVTGSSGAGGEAVALFLEVAREALRTLDVGDFCAALQQCAMDAADAPLSAIVLTKPGALPMTSSGKVRRGACWDMYCTGALTGVVHADAGARRLGAPAASQAV